MPSLDDMDLARQFAAGDPVAMQQVVDEHAPAIARLVHRMLGWPQDAAADDLVQEVFVRALVARKRFNHQSSLKTWLTRIAINECRAHFRKRQRRDVLLRAWHAGRPQPSVSSPDQQTEQDETALQVRTAIARLPTKYREAVVLHYLEEMTLAEVAEALGIQPGAAATRLSRARDKLRTLLEDSL